jgi:hypothetical protein
VQLSTPMTDGKSPNAAQVRVMRLGSQLVPMLDRHIPQGSQLRLTIDVTSDTH